MSAQQTIIQLILVTAALGHFVSVPAVAIAPRLGMLGLDDFDKLLPINYRIVLVVMGTIQMILIGSGSVVIWARGDLVNGSRLAVATTASLALLWLWRLAIQIFAYGPLFNTALTRWLHRLLVLLFAYMASAYALACGHAVELLASW